MIACDGINCHIGWFHYELRGSQKEYGKLELSLLFMFTRKFNEYLKNSIKYIASTIGSVGTSNIYLL